MKRLIVVVGAAIALGTAVSSAQGTSRAVPPQAVQSPAARWEADRAAMLKQVMERARTHVKDVHAMAVIGTMAPVDSKTAEKTLADLEKLADADSKRATRPAKSETEIAVLRQRLSEALSDLDLAEVKFVNGMITTSAMGDALAKVVNLLIAG